MAVVIGRNPKRTLIRALILAIATFVLFKFILLPIRVTGESMMPTCRNGKVTCVNRLSYKWANPRCGEVVAVKISTEQEVLLKRIVGLPHETIAMENGITKIDGRSLEEPYTQPNPDWSFGETKLGESEYLILGDNRSMDMGSHYFTIVSRAELIGKLLF